MQADAAGDSRHHCWSLRSNCCGPLCGFGPPPNAQGARSSFAESWVTSSMGDQLYLSCIPVHASIICIAETHPKDQPCARQQRYRAQAKARTQMAQVDILLVPTAAHHYTIQEILSQEDAPGKVFVAAYPVRCMIHPILSPAQKNAPVRCTSAVPDAAGGLPARIVQ